MSASVEATSTNPATAIPAIFQLVLGRDPAPPEWTWAAELMATTGSPLTVMTALLEGDEHQQLKHGSRFVPPGHFYSPQPSDADVARAREIDRMPGAIAGIDMRPEAQLALLEQFAEGYADLPFKTEAVPGLRYHYGNPNYSYSDAIFLASMIRHARPRRFIEVGSGDSSCALLDTNDHFFDGSIEITFVEPYPAYLNGLLGPEEAARIRMLPMGLQDVPVREFRELGSNDILFIDSTHVAKAGSDVNHLFFNILPLLGSGVYVHIHDVFASLEYPQAWLDEGRGWNEQYILRAFLEFNSAFEVVLCGDWMVRRHVDWFVEHMPLCLNNAGGAIWLRRR